MEQVEVEARLGSPPRMFQEPYRGFPPTEIFKPLFRFCHVGGWSSNPRMADYEKYGPRASCALAAPMALAIALTTLAALRLSGAPVHGRGVHVPNATGIRHLGGSAGFLGFGDGG
jgi:hypothetical protein